MLWQVLVIVALCKLSCMFSLAAGRRQSTGPSSLLHLQLVTPTLTVQVLKHVINQQRPDNGQKSDPGMPSSHANSECRLLLNC